MIITQVEGYSLAEEQIYTAAEWLYILQLYSKGHRTESSVPHQNLVSDEKFIQDSLSEERGK